MTLCSRFRQPSSPALALSATQAAARERVLQGLSDGRYPVEAVACFCGEPDGFTLAEIDRYGLPVRTVLCPRCGLLRTSPRMTAEATVRFYQHDYRDLYTGGAEPLYANQVSRGQGLVQRLPGLLAAVETVYDLGCGAGGILEPLARLGKRVAGCDFDAEYLAVGRGHGLELVQGDVDDLLAHCGGPADLILLVHVVEHFLDLRQELSRMVSAVRPGGYILIEVPGLRQLGEGAYHGDLLLYLQNAHNYHFTATTLAHVVQRVGLELVHVDEQAIAVARRPEGPWPVADRAAAPPSGEARRTLHFLGDLEKRHLSSSPLHVAAW